MRLRFLALVLFAAAAASACGSDPIVPVDASPDADMTDAVDLVTPDTMITMAPPALTNVAPARFEFTASEQATFKCRLDGGAEQVCTSPRMITGLPDGPHTFEVTAVDTSNLVDPTPATHNWRIDTMPPETIISSAPDNPDNSTSATFVFTVPFGEVGATFECSLDGAAFSACVSPLVLNNLSDGSHAFRVRAKDAAGNFDPTPEPYNWQVDTLSPDTVIDTGPAGIVNATSATFTFSSPGAGAGATFACHLDTAPFGPCTSPKTFVGLIDGPHVFEVRVTDSLGNTDPSPARRQWTIDSAGPITSITVRPNNPSNDTSPTFEFTASEQSTFECQIDGIYAYEPCVSPYTPAPVIPPGNRFFRIRATDVIGNLGPEATYEWLIDNAGPTVTITGGPSGPVASTTATFNWNSSEPATFCYRFSGDAQDTCTMALAGSGTVTRPGLAQGAQTFTVTATDALGNPGAPAVRNFSVDTVGPAVTITAGPMNTVGAIANLFTFSSAETSTFCYKVDGGGELCTPPPGGLTASVTVNANDGMHTLEVVARDVLGNRTAMPATRSWTVDTVRPTTTITAGPAQSSVLDTGNATVMLSASEPSTICWKIGAGNETCSAAGVMTFQADLMGLADGVIAFSAHASDAVGSGPNATRTWTVDTVRPTVNITAGPAMGSTVGSSEATFIVTSSERSTICWKWNNGAETCSPAGVTTFSPARSGLPEGANSFSVNAKDAIGPGATVDRSWTIDTVRPTVSITGGPAAGSTSGLNTPTFNISSNESSTICWKFDGGGESCSAAGVMSADAAPLGPLADGSHLFEVYGKDSIGGGTVVSRSWKVDTARPTITITNGPAQNSISGSTSATFTVTSSEPATICWQFNNGAQACTAAGQSSASITGTSLPAGATTFSVTGADAIGAGVAATRNWTIDLTRPSVTITAGPANNAVVNATSTQFTATTAEAAQICWRLDGAAQQCSAAGVMTVDIPFASLSQGSHLLALVATDAVGAGPVLNRSFTVDSVRPTVTVTSGPAEGSTTGSANVSFTVASSEASTICWRFNAAAFTCSAAGQTTVTGSAVGLSAGANTFDVKAADAVADGATLTVHFTVDLTRPTVTIASGPAQGSTTSNVFAAFTVNSTELSTFCWRFNSGPLVCSAAGLNTINITSNPLPSGNNVFSVYAADAVGAGAAVVRSWTVDSTRPVTSITAGPTENQVIDRNDPTFQLAASEASSFCWTVNGVGPPCTPPGLLTTTAHPTGLPEGPNTFSATAADNVGPGNPVVRHFVVDTVAPGVTISAPPADGARTNQTTASFTITSDEPATICWKLDGGPSTCSLPGALMFSANLVTLTEATHTFAVTATDIVLHQTTVSRVWTVDLTPPVVGIGAPTQNSFSNAVSPTFALTSSEPATICWSLDGVAQPPCSAPLSVTFNASPMNLTPGAHTLLVTAQDEAGVTGSLTRNWTVVRGLQAAASMTAESNSAGAQFGFAVASAGDVNGDGFADVLVGSPNFANGQADEGRVALFLGGAGGLAASPAWTFESDSAGAQLGFSVATAGDLNADGKADIVIGAPTYSNGQSNEGRIYVFLGTASGDLGTTPLFTYESDVVSAYFGFAVSGAGDVDADGKRDIVVGAPNYAAGQAAEGAVYLFRGTGATVAFSAVLDSNSAGVKLGYSISGGTDIDGDGKSDVVAGAPFVNNGQVDEGAVYLFRGTGTGLGMPTVYESDRASTRLGEAISSTGDIDGDGKADVVSGTGDYSAGQAFEGAAYVYLGAAGGLATPPVILERDQAGARFGIAVAIVGDVNGDAKADVLVGADSFDSLKVDNTLLSDGGAAFLYLGGAGGITTTPIWQAVGSQASSGYGFAVTGAGDINNDGRKDVVVGAPQFDNPEVNEGRAYQYLALAAGAKPAAPDVLDPAAPFGTVVQVQQASAWVRNSGVSTGEIATMDGAGLHCSLRGYLAVVGLECVVDGVALAPAYGTLGSLAKPDGAWHQVSIAFRGSSAELWIDGRLSDRTGDAASSLASGSVRVSPGAGSYSVDSLRLSSL